MAQEREDGRRTVWQDQAECRPGYRATVRELDKTFFPDVENAQSAQTAQDRFCSACPVWASCLTWSMENTDHGLYAGTTSKQRRAMSRKRDRVKCPTCQRFDPARSAVVEDGYLVTQQFCIGCGSSWMESTVRVDMVLDGSA